jgi:hypothetical protein
MAARKSEFWTRTEPRLWTLATAAIARGDLPDFDAYAVELGAPSGNACRMKFMELKRRDGVPIPDATRAAAPLPPLPPPPPEPDPLEADHPDLRRLERQLADAKANERQLRAKLKEADGDRSLYERLSDDVRGGHAFPVRAPLVKLAPSTKRTKVDAVAPLSDEHADAVISGPSTWGLEVYDFPTYLARLTRWAEVLVGYVTDYLPKHEIERLWIFKLGDSVNGDIHDHKYRNYFGNTLKAALATGDAEAEALEWVHCQTGVPLHVVGVSGNHPRRTTRKDYDGPHDNFDYLVNTQIATRLATYAAKGRVSVHAPEAWTAYVDVRGKVCALNHGDDVRGTWGIPWYGFSRTHNRVQALVARHAQRVDFFFHGHYHTRLTVSENHSQSVHSGAFTLTDPFALGAVAAAGEPSQPLLMIGDEAGERSLKLEVPVWLRDEAREQALRDGTWAPRFGAETVLDVVRGADGAAERGMMPLIRADTARASA